MRGSSHVHLLSSHTQRYKQAKENKSEDEEEKKQTAELQRKNPKKQLHCVFNRRPSLAPLLAHGHTNSNRDKTMRRRV